MNTTTANPAPGVRPRAARQQGRCAADRQLALFTFSAGAPGLPVAASVPVRTFPEDSPAFCQDIREVAQQVGLSIPVYAETGLLDAIRDPEDAFLWEVLWTARFHLETLQQAQVRFTLTQNGRDWRFLAQFLQPAGILLRLDQS